MVNYFPCFMLSMSFAFSLLGPRPESGISAAACPRYECKPQNMDFAADTCIFNSISDHTYYLNACDRGRYCPFPDFSPRANVTCISNENKRLKATYPGEPCITTNDCTYGTCNDSICQGKSLNDTCTENGECNPGLYCQAGRLCQTQIGPSGENCLNDFDCLNTAGCNRTSSNQSQCLSYLSVQNGDYVSDCDEERGFSLLCASETCVHIKDGKGRCVASYTSNSPLPVQCSGNQDCSGSNGGSQVVNSQCICGLNPNGDAYCMPHIGDSPSLRLINAFATFIDEGGSEKCNTMARFEYTCWAQSGLTKNLENLVLEYYRYYYYPELQNNPDCVIDIFIEPLTGSAAALLAVLLFVFN